MKTLTLEQVIAQVRAVAQGMEAIADGITGRTELKFYGVDAKPDDVVAALCEALPDWYGAYSRHADTCAWASISYRSAEITAFVTDEQAQAHIARQPAAA